MVLFNLPHVTLLKQSGFFNIKHHVNGLWNDILHDYFSATPEHRTFTISPEAYSHIIRSSELRADLLVSELVYYNDGPESDTELSPVLCYKGQGTGSTDGFAAIVEQLINWLEGTSAARKSERSLWVIGAKGSRFKVWAWCMECGLQGQLIPVKLAADRLPRLVVDRDPNSLKPCDLVKNAVLLNKLLLYVKDHPHPDVKEMVSSRRWEWIREIWELRYLSESGLVGHACSS